MWSGRTKMGGRGAHWGDVDQSRHSRQGPNSSEGGRLEGPLGRTEGLGFTNVRICSRWQISVTPAHVRPGTQRSSWAKPRWTPSHAVPCNCVLFLSATIKVAPQAQAEGVTLLLSYLARRSCVTWDTLLSLSELQSLSYKMCYLISALFPSQGHLESHIKEQKVPCAARGWT